MFLFRLNKKPATLNMKCSSLVRERMIWFLERVETKNSFFSSWPSRREREKSLSARRDDSETLNLYNVLNTISWKNCDLLKFKVSFNTQLYNSRKVWLCNRWFRCRSHPTFQVVMSVNKRVSREWGLKLNSIEQNLIEWIKKQNKEFFIPKHVRNASLGWSYFKNISQMKLKLWHSDSLKRSF